MKNTKVKSKMLALILAITIGSMVLNSLTVEAATTVIVNKTIVLTSSFNGGGKIYKHGPYLGDYPLFRLVGTGDTLSNVIIDDNNFVGRSPAVIVSGTGNSIKYCTLNNCVRYGFTAASATDFYIGYNTVNKAQYGISEASGGGNSYWASGVIENNKISHTVLCGIKVKAFKNVIIRNNYIDVTPYFKHNIQGIHFSADAPSINVIVENNSIIRANSGLYPSLGSIGLSTDDGPTIADPKIRSTGNVFRNNKVTDCYWGAILKGDNMKVSYNTIDTLRYRILNYGVNNIVSPNTFL